MMVNLHCMESCNLGWFLRFDEFVKDQKIFSQMFVFKKNKTQKYSQITELNIEISELSWDLIWQIYSFMCESAAFIYAPNSDVTLH